MPWTEWMALKHPLLAHVPAAVGLLLPWALVAAQRPGRGIKPWWTACRYLTIMGLVFTLVAGLGGFLAARGQGHLPAGLLAPRPPGLLRLHEILSLASLGLGALTLRTLFRKRQEHQGLGALSLLLGLLWSASLVASALFGHRMTAGRPVQVAPPVAEAKAEAKPVSPKLSALADPEAERPARMLDYQSLVPMHAEPVRSPLHGNRWVRVWVSPGAEAAYRAGQGLPEGALVVMNSQEDRWGRPGPEAGPLYALEMKQGKARLTYYWARVPEAKRGETGGQARAYWRDGDPSLAGCLMCHGAGLAPAKDRSTWTVPKKPKVPVPAAPAA